MNMNASILLLIASLAVGIGGWLVTLTTWAEALAPVAIGGLVMILGGIVAAWLGKSPIKPNVPPTT